MAHLLEEELFCSFCGNVQDMPQCCGRDMEYDGDHLFCPVCGRERKTPLCCDRSMVKRQRVRNIKKDIFSDRNVGGVAG